MKIVCNSSPLIFLAKLNKLSLLEPYTVLIPQEVHDELIAKECAEKDTLAVFFKAHNVSVVPLSSQIIQSKFLGKGEIAVINLALDQKIETVVMDDRRARSLARTTNLQTYCTMGILLSACKNNLLSKQEAYDLICDLPLHGFRIDQSFFLQILKKLK